MRHFLITALIAAIVSLGVIYTFSPAGTPSTKHETAYDRVIRTGVLRCAYGVWEPAIMRDPNTGKFSGLIYDFMQEVGKALNVKVEYNLEVSWDSIAIALKSGKADAHCAGVFATPARGRMMAFSNPLFFSPTVAFARAGDDRFDNHLDRINDPAITVALSDDDITTEIYNHDFPKAQKYSLAQFAPAEELFLAVATKKADVTINGPSRLQTYEKSNPGQIKVIPSSTPLRIFPNTISVDISEDQLLHMLNTAIDQIIDSGVMNKLVQKYSTKFDMSFLVQVDHPYTWKAEKNDN